MLTHSVVDGQSCTDLTSDDYELRLPVRQRDYETGSCETLEALTNVRVAMYVSSLVKRSIKMSACRRIK